MLLALLRNYLLAGSKRFCRTGLVDVEQEGKVLGLLQMGLLAGTLNQLRGQQL